MTSHTSGYARGQVRYERSSRLAFLDTYRTMCVAMTRPRRHLKSVPIRLAQVKQPMVALLERYRRGGLIEPLVPLPD